MKKHYTLWLLVPLLAWASCNFNALRKATAIDLSQLEPLVAMEKGPCFGRCPVYSMKVYENGVASYEGKQFSDLEGLHVKRISKTALAELKSTLESANLFRFQDAYRSRLPDLQSVKITYYTEDRYKSIIGKDGRPGPVVEIQELLEEIVEGGGWEPKNAESGEKDSNIVENQMRVQLMNGVDINAWVRRYRRQEMTLIRGISANSNYWLVGFNAQKNEPEEVLAIVQADVQVVNAEFDRKAGQ